jgi:hypothetical protein
MRLTSTGLGIGTSSPTTQLQIAGASFAIMRLSAASNNVARVDFGTVASPDVGRISYDNATSGFTFRTNGSDSLYLNSTGNLGLGVAPSAWLSTYKAFQNGRSSFVNDDSGRLQIMSNAFVDSGGAYRYIASTFASLDWYINGERRWYTAVSGTAGNAITFTQAMTLDASGNLGVGTTSPSTRLHIAGSTTATSQLTTQHTGSSITTLFGCDGAIDVGAVYVTTNHPLAFKTNNTERARIDSSGNLLVGLTSDSYQPSKGVAINAQNSSRIAVGHASGVASGDYYCSFAYNEGVIGSISQNGTTAVAYNTSSDYRLKNTIAPMTGALAKVALLKPCTYKWNADGSDGEGFIAHELAEIVPQCVTGEKDAVDEDGNPKYQGIDTSFLVATLTAAIQEQQAIIESLKARLDAANL